MPGDSINEGELSAAQAEWLLKSGAIIREDDGTFEALKKICDDAGEAEAGAEEAPEEAPAPEADFGDEEAPESEAGATFSDEEAPEIDLMDGIVQPAPKKRAGGRKAK